eukprot:g17297.t1
MLQRTLEARLMLQLATLLHLPAAATNPQYSTGFTLMLFPQYSTGITLNLKLLQRKHRSKTNVNSKQVSTRTRTRKKHCWARVKASVEAFCENASAPHFHDPAKCNADPRCQFDTRTCLASHPHYESFCENPDAAHYRDPWKCDALSPRCGFDGHHCCAAGNNPDDAAFCEDPHAAHFLDLEKCDQLGPRCHFGGPDPPHCWAKDPKELEAWCEDETQPHFYDEAACDQDPRCSFEGHHCLASSPEDRVEAGFCENPSEPHFYDPKTCSLHAGCHFFDATRHTTSAAATMAPALFLDLPTVFMGDGRLRNVGNLHEKTFHRLWSKDQKLQHVLQQAKIAYKELVELMPTDGPSLGKSHKVALKSPEVELRGQAVRRFETGQLMNILSSCEEVWREDKANCNMLQERAQVAMDVILEEQNLHTLLMEERRVFKIVAQFMGQHVWHPELYWSHHDPEKYWMGARMLFDKNTNPRAGGHYKMGAEKNVDAADSNFHTAWERNNFSSDWFDKGLGSGDAEKLLSEALAPLGKRPSDLGKPGTANYRRKFDPTLERHERNFNKHLREHKGDSERLYAGVSAGDREQGDNKLRSKFGHKQTPPDAIDLHFVRTVRRQTENMAAELIAELDLLKKETVNREVEFAPRRAELMFKIYDTNSKFNLLSTQEADLLQYEHGLLRKQRKLLNLITSVLDEIREVRIDFFARIELVDKEAELHIAIDDQLTSGKYQRPASLPARVAAHQALQNAFRIDAEDKPGYGSEALRKAAVWEYDANEHLFDETSRKLVDIMGVNIFELVSTPIPQKQAYIHAELEILNVALLEMERDLPEKVLFDGRLTFLHDLIRRKLTSGQQCDSLSFFSVSAHLDAIGAEVAKRKLAVMDMDDHVAVSFHLATGICLASTVFFFLQVPFVPARWRNSMVVAGLVTGTAWHHYQHMQDLWEDTKKAPTIYRYMDWLITVPMQVVQFYLIALGEAAATAGKLGISDAKRFLAFLSGTDEKQNEEKRIMDEAARKASGQKGQFQSIVSGVTDFYSGRGAFGSTVNADQVAMKDWKKPEAQLCFEILRAILVFGWALYPVGYAAKGDGNGITETEENTLNGRCWLCSFPVYNVADLLNKVAFGFAIYYAASSNAEAEKDDLNRLREISDRNLEQRDPDAGLAAASANKVELADWYKVQAARKEMMEEAAELQSAMKETFEKFALGNSNAGGRRAGGASGAAPTLLGASGTVGGAGVGVGGGGTFSEGEGSLFDFGGRGGNVAGMKMPMPLFGDGASVAGSMIG